MHPQGEIRWVLNIVYSNIRLIHQQTRENCLLQCFLIVILQMRSSLVEPI